MWMLCYACCAIAYYIVKMQNYEQVSVKKESIISMGISFPMATIGDYYEP